MACTRVAAEEGKMFSTAGFNCYLIFLFFFPLLLLLLYLFLSEILYISYCPCLILIQAVSIEGTTGMSFVALSAERLADLLVGAARTLFSLISVR